MKPSQRAFRFAATNVNYAIDILPDGKVYLLAERSNGWENANTSAGPLITLRIPQVGDEMKLCALIIEAVNPLLRLLAGSGDKSTLPEAADGFGRTLDALNANFRPHVGMDGVTQIVPRIQNR